MHEAFHFHTLTTEGRTHAAEIAEAFDELTRKLAQLGCCPPS